MRRHGTELGGLATALSAALVIFVSSASAVAQDAPRYWGSHMWEGGWWFFGPFTMVLFLAVPILLVVLLVRWLTGTGAGTPAPSTEKTALDILRERFARGEIDAGEFEDRKKVLKG